MTKKIHYFFIMLFILTVLTPISAQTNTANKDFNPLYKPIRVIQKLSYDNFKKIKLLHAAIKNFGGGQAEFDKLVDVYAEASALYFQKEMLASANLFTKNKRDIDKMAMEIAKRYKEDTDKLHLAMIKMNIRYNITRDIEGKKPNPYNDRALGSASYAVQKASDYYVRTRPVHAIIYFRRAKSSCFDLYKILEMEIPDKFKRDMVDNKNKIYTAKEKKT